METVEMKQVEGGVCAARGFSAKGLNCGLNPDKNKNDLALIYSERDCKAAAVYTTNKVKGAPILVTKKNLAASGSRTVRMRIPAMQMAKRKPPVCVNLQRRNLELTPTK